MAASEELGIRRPKRLTFGMVREAWLRASADPAAAATESEDDQAGAILKATELNLSWLDIETVDDTLDPFNELQELYLQHNRIQEPIGSRLAPLKGLRLLMLSHNKLVCSDLKGLELLPLEALDLQSNCLEALEDVIGCLSKSLRHLWLRDNPCVSFGSEKHPACPPRIAAALPELQSFEGRGLDDEAASAGTAVESMREGQAGKATGEGAGESKVSDGEEEPQDAPPTAAAAASSGEAAAPAMESAADPADLPAAVGAAALARETRQDADHAYDRRMRALTEQHERTAADLAGDVARRVHGIAETAVDRSKARLDEMRLAHDERMRSLQARLERSLEAVRAPAVPAAVEQPPLTEAAEAAAARLASDGNEEAEGGSGGVAASGDD